MGVRVETPEPCRSHRRRVNNNGADGLLLLGGYAPEVRHAVHRAYPDLICMILGRSMFSTNLYQMLFDDDEYDPDVW